MCQPSLAIRAGDALHHVLGRRIDEALDEIETDAFHAGLVQIFQLGVGDVFADEGDALGFAVGMNERVDQRAIIRVMTGRLHDDVLVEAEKIAQREQLFLWRIAGRVFPLRRERKRRFRTEHVAMRIDRARRRLVFRLRRIGVERNVTRRHRHAAFLLFIVMAREGGPSSHLPPLRCLRARARHV